MHYYGSVTFLDLKYEKNVALNGKFKETYVLFLKFRLPSPSKIYFLYVQWNIVK
jgi:hypothetical protein